MNSTVLRNVPLADNYNNTLAKFYTHVFFDLSDPRTKDWFLLSSPVPGLTILSLWLYFVLSWGPKFMEQRKPYQLKNILVIYNLFQVLLSIWLFWEGLDAAWLRDYSWKCQPVDFSNNPKALRVASAVYMYFLAKMTELLDTVFFVLRKKDRQISFLHMYHHTVMPMVSWGAAKYYPGGHGTLLGVINSFVHIVMYTYYLLAAVLPQYQKYFWWKKYITTLQMAQFCITFLHNCQLLIYDCKYPRWSVFVVLPNAVFFYLMFSDFYNKAYLQSEADALKKKNDDLDSEKRSNGKSNGHCNGQIHQNGNGIANGKAKNGTAHQNGKSKAA